MISLLQFIYKKTFDNNNDNDSCKEKIESETIIAENLLAELDDLRQSNEEKKEEQGNYMIEDEGCFYKTGTVTTVNNEYIVIENKYMCEIKSVIPKDLKKGDKVYYIAYKINKNDELKIRRIEYRIENAWENETCETENLNVGLNTDSENKEEINSKTFTDQPDKKLNINTYNSDKIVEIRKINKRTVIGKVIKRQGREIHLEDGMSVSLDKIICEFVPYNGDWVKLECIVEVDTNSPNLTGEVLEVESIAPLRQYNKLDTVTSYDESTESGVISDTVFTKAVCNPGYIPCAGDKVAVHKIESDQGVVHRWRALLVVPIEDVVRKFETSTVQYKPAISRDDLDDMIKDKENMEITNQIRLELDARAQKEFEITVKNNGDSKQILHKCSFLSKKSNSQIILLSPKDAESQHLKPGDELVYKFRCTGKMVGLSEELIIFKFKKFKVGRLIQIVVNSIMPTIKADKEEISIGNRFHNKNVKTAVMPESYEEGMYIRGVKPYKSAKFVAIRPVTWKIPTILLNTMNMIETERKTRAEAEFTVSEKIPLLQQPLKFENYKERFKYLLYLEEIAQIQDMRRFDIKSIVMHKSGEFLTLNVPGLAEKRPSLIIGDKVIVSFSWDATAGEKKYEGFIHKIRSSDVYLKFNQKFHEDYHGEDCEVVFKGSTTVLQRCHAAIGVVREKLGSEFLFPKKVIEKEPQYNFVEDDSDDEEEVDDENNQLKKLEALLHKKKINWFNKQMNIYQKEAVKNILKGLARPLPYVIFGPPGTGKTITVCEAVLQIFFTMSESRILIATPSNSSANLIAEKLLDSNLLRPGDMVRLVAFHYLDSDLVPEKLVPYCVTADIANEGTRADVNIQDPRGCRTNVTLSVLCRHRIIIGTCTALGILYNMGCKQGHFTHMVIDEAGQACEPEIMIPLSLAHRDSTQIILAGDPKQLGPVNQSRLAGYFGLNDSFLLRLLHQFPYQKDPTGFEFGYDPRLVTKLLMNYRSLPDLLDLPNKLFYEAELIAQVDPEDSEEAELLEKLSDMLPKRLGTPPAVVFHNVKGQNIQDPDSPSWYNPEEASQVYIYLLDLYNRGLEPADIGIITPYSKQVYRIKHLLAELDVDVPKVGSVEEFQGQERKVIILSTVRTASEKVQEDIKHSLGFVSARERLNVGITRARTLLIIIGSAELLEKDVYWRSVIDHCKSRSAFIGRGLTGTK